MTAIDSIVQILRDSYSEDEQKKYYSFSPEEEEQMEDMRLPLYVNLQDDDTILHSVPPSYMYRQWLVQFINSKSNEQVISLTTHQLKQRVSHFLNYLDKEDITDLTTSDVLSYIDHLRSEGRSAKTNKDYFASTKQFLSWCAIKEYITKNPAESLKPTFKKTKHASEQRVRWNYQELTLLFNSKQFKRQSEDLQWISLLQLFNGFRPQEPCQLYINDIHCDEAIPYISIADYYPFQHLKNQHAVRDIPIHPYLIESGFLEFVASRATGINKPLFNYDPLGKDNDWSKLYRTQFGKLQTRLGMIPKHRPTTYSLRHTFIDELKLLDVPEHLVAEIVGHNNPNMTYGRYGKKTKLPKLLEIISMLQLEGLSC